MEKKDLFYLLALQHAPNLGDFTAKKLLRRCGSAEAIFKEKKSNLSKVEGIGAIRIKALQQASNFKAAEAEMKFIETHHIQTLYYKDEEYPEKLKHCQDGPLLLFSRGNMSLEKQKIISIVGTRNSTPQGNAFCEQFIEELSVLDPIIVSGFAYGIDIAAHKSAFKNKLQTIACLAHGFNLMYPKAHRNYSSQVEENGGFLTDFWSSDSFGRNNFLKRNRIIAGLSEATIVIESAEKGGALVTADIANSYNREVFAVPGRPTDNYSRGCNNLLKMQKAQMLTCAADLVYHLNWEEPKLEKPVQKQLFVDLEEEEQQVFNFLKNTGKAELDAIALHCQYPTFKTAGFLLNMELKGVVRPLPGKLFEVV